ncbi:hypothetical protein [Bacillus cereus]|uniref:hypothetical protein n=1 Tax=Bacillus cereus group TaxID=86661 RepID=UPI001558D226|nr:hypothetical protein [Bacillus cereus]MBJ7951854.1 hypothetical protein [Bacillus cereus]MBX9155947.1 hypothetical protein [Bacillus cereus]MDZ4608437.1 hypothetical protein [Bacillus cereus]
MKGNGVQEIISVAEEFGLDSMVDIGMDLMPYVSSFRNMVKFNRLERRMKEHSDQLKRIGQLSKSSTLAADYIAERIFPIVLADLIEEHEDAKIHLILNGFENVFIEEKSEESIVINYYDTLRNLRYKDVRRFLDLVGVTGSYDTPLIITEEAAIISGIDVKLESNGLVSIDRVGIGHGQYAFVSPADVKETHYGKRFLKFILSKEKKVAES